MRPSSGLATARVGGATSVGTGACKGCSPPAAHGGTGLIGARPHYSRARPPAHHLGAQLCLVHARDATLVHPPPDRTCHTRRGSTTARQPRDTSPSVPPRSPLRPRQGPRSEAERTPRLPSPGLTRLHAGPLEVAGRALEIAATAAPFLLGVAWDRACGPTQESHERRAAQLVDTLVRLGPSFVKARPPVRPAPAAPRRDARRAGEAGRTVAVGALGHPPARLHARPRGAAGTRPPPARAPAASPGAPLDGRIGL